MQFSGPHHEQTYQKIHQYLKSSFGETFLKSDEFPVFAILRGTSFTHILVSPTHPDLDENILVRLTAPLVKDVDITLELATFLLQLNQEVNFGTLSLDDNQWILLTHTLIAETCSQEELFNVLQAFSSYADELDSLIIGKFGGTYAIELN